MNIYIICDTNMKERAILEYHNIPYEYVEEVVTNFPIKDIQVNTLLNIEDIINLLERPRKIYNNTCAKLIVQETKEIVEL